MESQKFGMKTLKRTSKNLYEDLALLVKQGWLKLERLARPEILV